MKAGASGVHFEDQLSSEKKCGHLGGKVLLPTQTTRYVINSARLAADVMGSRQSPTIIVARTDADAADLITSDIDPVIRRFLLQGGEKKEHQKDFTVRKQVLIKRLHVV